MPSGSDAGDEQGHMAMDDLRDASDAALVVAIGRWREDALAEAYRRHAGAAFALARRLLNDRTLAEEILQEVFLRLWNRPERFDAERGSLRSYLLAQTHGRSVDLLRSDTSRRRREERDAREPPESPTTSSARSSTSPSPSRSKRRWPPCPPTSARPSSWPTSVATPTGRWPCMLGARREP